MIKAGHQPPTGIAGAISPPVEHTLVKSQIERKAEQAHNVDKGGDDSANITNAAPSSKDLTHVRSQVERKFEQARNTRQENSDITGAPSTVIEGATKLSRFPKNALQLPATAAQQAVADTPRTSKYDSVLTLQVSGYEGEKDESVGKGIKRLERLSVSKQRLHHNETVNIRTITKGEHSDELRQSIISLLPNKGDKKHKKLIVLLHGSSEVLASTREKHRLAHPVKREEFSASEVAFMLCKHGLGGSNNHDRLTIALKACEGAHHVEEFARELTSHGVSGVKVTGTFGMLRLSHQDVGELKAGASLSDVTTDDLEKANDRVYLKSSELGPNSAIKKTVKI